MSDDLTSAPIGKGKLAQAHKRELKEFHDNVKRELSRIKNKETRRETEEAFKVKEAALHTKHTLEINNLEIINNNINGGNDNNGNIIINNSSSGNSTSGVVNGKNSSTINSSTINSSTINSSTINSSGVYNINATNEDMSLYGCVTGVSKSQRKRDKKAHVEEQKRLDRILEIGDTISPQTLESQALESVLLSVGLSTHDVPSDGNCLYRAISHQLTLLNKFQNGSIPTHECLREMCAEYLLDHKDEFLPYLEEAQHTEEGYTKYCLDVKETAVWGGEVEIRALSEVLKVPIEVYSASSPLVVHGEAFGGDPIRLSFHKHLLALGAHYNSLIPRTHTEMF
eukprot:GHVR01177849.1.p1 GENE.GHVR01177849.1~~GHVR01177849.1.p1  ORF type:complete len:340 (+),score=100.77 GHVR01177849.1:242-1261(+)